MNKKKHPTGIVLVISKDNAHNKANISILKRMTYTYKLNGIHVTLLTPHSTIIEKIKQQKIPLERVFFIDGTNSKCTDNIKTNHYQNIQGPEALTELSIAISEQANSGSYQFALLDSLSVLRLYNDLETTSRFIRFLTNKLKLIGITCIILSVREQETEKLNSLITQLAENIIEI